MTRFKELCMDTAEDGTRLGRFWAAATGCSFAEPSAGDAADPGDVVGEVEGMGIAMCRVPERKTVKHRVHIDLHTDSVDTLLDLGATRAPGWDADDPWTVLLDPEGGEFCAFVRDRVPAYRLYELVIDSFDPERIARWWGQVFGVQPTNDGRDFWWLEGVPGMPFEAMVFGSVPEPKTVKNRIHWDVYGDVDELRQHGGALLAVQPRWTVLADPEGNEFCVFAPSVVEERAPASVSKPPDPWFRDGCCATSSTTGRRPTFGQPARPSVSGITPVGRARSAPMARIELTVDGYEVSDDVEPRMLLVQYLREKLGKTGTVIGCDTSNCGACTVHLDGRSVKSCNVLAVQADGREVTTIEGLATNGTMHAVQEAFRECHGLQCGFCTPGMIMQSVDLLNDNPSPSEEEIRVGLEGNLCRCTGYHNIVRAVQAAAGGDPA